MEEDNIRIKCSAKEHEKIDAISFCHQCDVYMCIKCDNFHKNLCQSHITYNINKNIDDIFTGYCKEKGHNNKIEYFCKNHNQLCCNACIIKINLEGRGQHKDCDICFIKEIKESKKNKLKENINYLEELVNNIEEKIKQLKTNIDKINEGKEELKLKIQKVFTKIRNIINKREEILLSDVDNKFDEKYFNENKINEIQNLPNKIKLILEKGKLMGEEWNDENKLSSFINDCINIENKIKITYDINDKLKKYNEKSDYKFDFYPTEDNIINKLLEPITSFGKIYCGNSILFDSKIIERNEQYINNIIKWINCKSQILTQLLYRMTDNGDSYDIFHQLCDNKGTTLILIKGKSGFIIGGYTPLDWDSISGFKKDNQTFLFSLTKNEIYIKNENSPDSIKCSKNCGPYFHCFGFKQGNNMSKVYVGSGCANYNNLEKIISDDKETGSFGVDEVEVFKIIFN